MKNDVVFANALNFRCLFLALYMWILVIYTNGCQLDCRKNLRIYQVDCNFKNKLFIFIKLRKFIYNEKKEEKLGDMLHSIQGFFHISSGDGLLYLLDGFDILIRILKLYNLQDDQKWVNS